jgi:hypothetical protein
MASVFWSTNKVKTVLLLLCTCTSASEVLFKKSTQIDGTGAVLTKDWLILNLQHPISNFLKFKNSAAEMN